MYDGAKQDFIAKGKLAFKSGKHIFMELCKQIIPQNEDIHLIDLKTKEGLDMLRNLCHQYGIIDQSAQNISKSVRNRRNSAIKKSKYKGVNWHKVLDKWHVCLCYQGKKYSCGYYDDEEMAKRAYDDKLALLRAENA